MFEILFEIDLCLIVNEKLQGTKTLQVIRYTIIYRPTLDNQQDLQNFLLREPDSVCIRSNCTIGTKADTTWMLSSGV